MIIPFMQKNTFHKLITFFLLILLIFPAAGVNAQEENGQIIINQLNTEAFPLVNLSFEANFNNNQALTQLNPSEITITEDGSTAALVESVEVIEPGVQFIVAYNLTNSFVNINSAGLSRYEAILTQLLSWIDTLPQQNQDDFSLATSTGLQAIRLNDAGEFGEVLANYTPDFTQVPVGSTSLIQSLDLATDPNPNPLMKRSILYITAVPGVNEISAFEGIINRAVQQDVQVNVWLVGPAATPEISATAYEPLVNLTQQTNGHIFIYSGEEGLPNPEDYLAPLREQFQIQYISQINTEGTHQIAVSINKDGLTLQSAPVETTLDIKPPNPIVLNPPVNILRDWVEDETSGELILMPQTVELNYITEFVDGFERPITRAALFANGNLISEQIEAPFDTLTWDLSEFDFNQNVELSIEVEDSLSLISDSSPMLISIEVTEKPLTFWQSFSKISPQRWIILISVLTTGTVLVLAVFLIGKKNNFWRKNKEVRKRFNDPVTQPVPIYQEKPSQPIKRSYSQKTNAWLVPLDEDFIAQRGRAVPLNLQELVIGSDQKQATLVLSSKAIENVHAYIKRGNEGGFWISDNQSTAGTWVNYAPVSNKGKALQDGDLVHFGKFIYRFESSPILENQKN